WALSACGVVSREATGDRTSQGAPQLLVELKTLPHGHPPVPGYSSPSTLPEGHPPVPGLHPAPALPQGHPRCPASGSLETPPADAGTYRMLQSPPDIVST
ncbi:MAG: hypothetical protein OEW35_21915, partial [Gammaproteobacteria bacterium]|nr:hypothetical protein [Gammaproteobacteria bacterium]